jgi:hypothetical protein
MGRCGVGGLVALGALGCAMAVIVVPAQGYTAGAPAEPPPGLVCLNEKESNQVVEEYARLLSPADGATVQAGAPVTFSAESGLASPMTFMVASSPALLSSPDIDGGLGSLVRPEYSFTSTKAAATPRTIYWTASFTRTLRDCEKPPVTFTLPPRMLTVLPSSAEQEAAAKQQQAEAAVRKKHEEEVAGAGRVVLDGFTMDVGSGGEALLELTCADVSSCAGKLTLTVKRATRKTKQGNAKTTTIGTAGFAIPPGKTASVEVALNGAGHTLLGAAHGHISAGLTIVKSSPAPAQTLVENVRLVRQKAHGGAKK